MVYVLCPSFWGLFIHWNFTSSERQRWKWNRLYVNWNLYRIPQTLNKFYVYWSQSSYYKSRLRVTGPSTYITPAVYYPLSVTVSHMSQQSRDDVYPYKYPAVTPLSVSLFNRVSRNEQQPLPLWRATLAAPRGGLSSGPAAPAHILNTLVAFLETPALWRRDYDMETARRLLSSGGAQGSPLLSASTWLCRAGKYWSLYQIARAHARTRNGRAAAILDASWSWLSYCRVVLKKNNKPHLAWRQTIQFILAHQASRGVSMRWETRAMIE